MRTQMIYEDNVTTAERGEWWWWWSLAGAGNGEARVYVWTGEDDGTWTGDRGTL